MPLGRRGRDTSLEAVKGEGCSFLPSFHRRACGFGRKVLEFENDEEADQ
jgi:hypothetical protein